MYRLFSPTSMISDFKVVRWNQGRTLYIVLGIFRVFLKNDFSRNPVPPSRGVGGRKICSRFRNSFILELVEADALIIC